MALALKRYMVCLGALVALMALYGLVLAPQFEPPTRIAGRDKFDTEDSQPAAYWKHLFAPDAWQNSNPMVIQTQQCTLLYKSLKQIDPNSAQRANQWRLEPLTLIVPMSRVSKSASVGDLNAASQIYRDSPLAVIVAETADIQFQSALDLSKSSMPPVTDGLLRGPIQITGIDPRKGPGPQWTLKTSNVRIDRRRISTPNAVEILAGNSIARGQDLTIHLKHNLLGPGVDDGGPWGLLDRMELIYVQQVSFSLGPGGLWKGLKLGDPAIQAKNAQKPATINLKCKGMFHFDFEQSQARLFDHIRMEHRFEGDSIHDELLCQELLAQFSTRNESSDADAGEASRSANAVTIGPMNLDWVDALGVDATGPQESQRTVSINAPNVATQVTAKHLRMQLDKRQIMIDDRSGTVQVNHAGNVFRAPVINYEAAADNRQFGRMIAPGPGEIETSGQSPLGHAKVRWEKNLQVMPLNQGHLITLEGPSLIEADTRGHLAGKHIEITLGRKEPSAEFQIERMDAMGDVILGNDSQMIRIGKLHLKFVYPQTQIASAHQAEVPSPGLSLIDSSGRPMYQWVGPPSNSTSGQLAAVSPRAVERVLPPVSLPVTAQVGTPLVAATQNRPAQVDGSLDPSSSSSGKSNQRPVILLGKELVSQIIVTSQQSWIDQLQIDGPVLIKRDGPPTTETAWRIEGGQLQLAGSQTGQLDMQIVGQPARVHFGDGWIEGPIIRLNQSTSQIWMDQPGTFSVPGNLISTRTSGQIQWIEPIKCRWQGRMLFNGTTANIDGGIIIDGVARTAPNRLLFVRATAEAAELKLTESVNFSQPSAAEVSLQSLALRRNVDIRVAQNDTMKRRLSLEEINLPELVFDVQLNRIVGTGPGWVRSQHFSNGGGGGTLGLGTLAAGSSTPAQLQLQGLHLKFRNAMQADLNDRQVSFSGKVELGIGPVASWEEFIDLDAMRILKPEQTLLGGDLLRATDLSDFKRTQSAATQLAPGPTSEGAWEFEAMGNVVFEGRREAGEFAGRAHTISYNQTKELIVMAGDGRLPAELNLRKNASSSLLLKVIRASLNTRTMDTPGLELSEVQAIPGNSSVRPGTPGPSAQSQLPSAAPVIRPRDSVGTWNKAK